MLFYMESQLTKKEENGMKRKAVVLMLVMVAAVQLTACGSKTCSVSGCDEEVYKDGYCEVHYYANEAGNVINGLFN